MSSIADLVDELVGGLVAEHGTKAVMESLARACGWHEGKSLKGYWTHPIVSPQAIPYTLEGALQRQRIFESANGIRGNPGHPVHGRSGK